MLVTAFVFLFNTSVFASTTVLERRENIYNDDRSVKDISSVTTTSLQTSDQTGFTKIIGNRLIKEETGLYFDKPYDRNEYRVNVIHYKENANDSNYTKDATVPITHKYEYVFNPTTKSYYGFQTTSSRSYEVPAKDSDFRYDYLRQRHTLTVNHKIGNIGNTSYSQKNSNTYTLKYQQNYTPARRSYTGFTAPAGSAQTMGVSDYSMTYNYPRNQYKLTLTAGDAGIQQTSGSGTYYYEQDISASCLTKPHSSGWSGDSSPGPGARRVRYWVDTKFNKWSNGVTSQNWKSKMPARDVSLTATSVDTVTTTQVEEEDTAYDDGGYVYGPPSQVTPKNGFTQGKKINDENDSEGCPGMSCEINEDNSYTVEYEYWSGHPGDGGSHGDVWYKGADKKKVCTDTWSVGKNDSSHYTGYLYYDGYVTYAGGGACGGKSHGSLKMWVYAKTKTWSSNWKWSTYCTAWGGPTHSWPSEDVSKQISL